MSEHFDGGLMPPSFIGEKKNMIKKLKKFRVNAVIKVNFPLWVIAENEDEAIEKCEKSLYDSNLEIYSDTVGVEIPNDEMDDDYSTSVFEMYDYEAEAWSDFDFSIDKYTEAEDVELEYDEDEDDEIE